MTGNQGKIVGPAKSRTLKTPAAGFEIAAAVTRGFLRENAYRAAFGVLAEQRTLWTAENLDAVDVRKIEYGTEDGPEIDIVNIEADTRLERVFEIVLTDTADGHEGGFAEARAGLLDVHIRGGVCDIGYIDVAASVDLVGGNSRDGDRRGL